MGEKNPSLFALLSSTLMDDEAQAVKSKHPVPSLNPRMLEPKGF